MGPIIGFLLWFLSATDEPTFDATRSHILRNCGRMGPMIEFYLLWFLLANDELEFDVIRGCRPLVLLLLLWYIEIEDGCETNEPTITSDKVQLR